MKNMFITEATCPEYQIVYHRSMELYINSNTSLTSALDFLLL
jgi:hypothetical protein